MMLMMALVNRSVLQGNVDNLVHEDVSWPTVNEFLNKMLQVGLMTGNDEVKHHTKHHRQS